MLLGDHGLNRDPFIVRQRRDGRALHAGKHLDNLSKEKLEILDELLFRFEAIQVAEGKKYVLLNAPKEKLDEISTEPLIT